MSAEKPGMVPALQQAAAFLEAHPDLPEPYVTAGSWGYADVSWYLQTDTRDHAQQKATAAAILRGVGGKWDKRPGATFNFRQNIGGLRLEVTVEREAVCERIVTGTETVTVPAIEAQPEQTVEREVVEWRCAPLLADAEVSA